MQFKNHAAVYDASGKKVGHVKSLVMDPHTNEVTNLIIEQGFLFKNDRVMPVDWVYYAEKDNGDVHLKNDDYQFEGLPSFEAVRYTPTDYVPDSPEILDVFPPSYYYVGMPGIFPAYPYTIMNDQISEERHFVPSEVENIPENSVPLRIGQDVRSRDGEKVGKVEEVIMDDSNNRITHLVLSHGVLNASLKLIPVAWLDAVVDGAAELAVNQTVLDRLGEYHPET